ncbi:MAG: DNA-protecting protein DprA [Bacteroidetes bacterium]|nr:DNA-protecting protein DprA [Bacteroidota bacterium]
MESEEELLHRIALSLLPNVGPVIARALYSHCGSAVSVFKERKSLLSKIPGVGPKRIQNAFNVSIMDRAAKELAFVKKHKLQVLFYTDDAYPNRLQQCADAPCLLYYKGNATLNLGRFVAIVGTRSSTTNGEEVTKKLVEELQGLEVTMVSGLAYGIDICAHEAALQFGIPTIGVTAHGMDRIYPQLHRTVAGKMLSQGGILTEYPSQTPPDRENFPSRNRIVAGMCDAVVVVEASSKGGALITADLAQGYDREVFAFPGRVSDEFSKGCNEYIRDNKAALITCAHDLIWLMGWSDDKKKEQVVKQTQLFFELNEDEIRVVDVLKEKGECGIDVISSATALPFSKLANTLLQLELKNAIKLKAGKRYSL